MLTLIHFPQVFFFYLFFSFFCHESSKKSETINTFTSCTIYKKNCKSNDIYKDNEFFLKIKFHHVNINRSKQYAHSPFCATWVHLLVILFNCWHSHDCLTKVGDNVRSVTFPSPHLECAYRGQLVHGTNIC